jgi:hypothetical protein
MRAEDVPPDAQNHTERNGVVLRKGTVAAFLVKAKVWSDPAADTAQRQAAERNRLNALPGLRALDLFEVFSIRDAALRRLVETH